MKQLNNSQIIKSYLSDMHKYGLHMECFDFEVKH